MQILTNYTDTILSTADLQKQPIDLHILPLSDPQTGNWQASGFYINDDGLNVNFVGEINSYQITATGTYIALQPVQETITIGMMMDIKATNH